MVTDVDETLLARALAKLLAIFINCGVVKVISFEDTTGIQEYREVFDVIVRRPLGLLKMLFILIYGGIVAAILISILYFLANFFGVIGLLPPLVWKIFLVILAIPLCLTLVTATNVFQQIWVVHDRTSFSILKECIRGCFKNMLPIAIYNLTGTLLLIPVALTLGLGVIVYVPVCFLAHYQLCKNLIEVSPRPASNLTPTEDL